MRDIYGQMFSPDGQKIGSEFLINQFTTYNQRTPAIASLGSGGFRLENWRQRPFRARVKIEPQHKRQQGGTGATPVYALGLDHRAAKSAHERFLTYSTRESIS